MTFWGWREASTQARSPIARRRAGSSAQGPGARSPAATAARAKGPVTSKTRRSRVRTSRRIMAPESWKERGRSEGRGRGLKRDGRLASGRERAQATGRQAALATTSSPFRQHPRAPRPTPETAFRRRPAGLPKDALSTDGIPSRLRRRRRRHLPRGRRRRRRPDPPAAADEQLALPSSTVRSLEQDDRRLLETRPGRLHCTRASGFAILASERRGGASTRRTTR